MAKSVLMIDGANEAIIGYFQRCGEDPLLVYCYDKLHKVFVDQGMTEDEATEWISYNVEGSLMGKGTPAILHKIESFNDLLDFCAAYDLDEPDGTEKP